MVRGERFAWMIDAPLVYSVENGETELSGGSSESLAFQIKETIQKHLPNVHLEQCQGSVADGQYLNQKFTVALGKEFKQASSFFTFIMWDAAHFLDLAAKKFQTTDFMKRLLKRVQLFHTKLGYMER